MLISLVVPIYNVEKFLAQCLESCINQQSFSQHEYEIIIINDGSPDNSFSIAEKYQEKYPELISIYSQKNAGLSSARNNGVNYANGNFVWFIDSDDWIAKESLSLLKPHLIKSNDMIVIGGMHVKENCIIAGRKHFQNIKCMTGEEAFIHHVEQTQAAPCTIYRRDFLKKNNLKFVEGLLHEDLEFCPKATYLAKQITFTPFGIYYNRMTQRISITSIVQPKRSFDLLKVVQLLDSFEKQYVKDYKIKRRFYTHEAIALNNALNNITFCSKNDQILFRAEYALKASLYNKILTKSSIRNKIESLLFRLFHNNIVAVYKMLLMLR